MRAITLIWIVFLTACTPRAVREAESVVAQADSLRAEGRVYGIDEGDSATLAQAYETLKKYSEVSRQFSEICPFIPCTSSLYTYAHACYHYGRLLREKDNPVEAMQVFINATHSCTRDYHILGRVYSNMGSICHLAGDYPLSYDMYEKSAQVFLQGEDTLSYYYLLNDMAFELAEQGKKEETLSLLSQINYEDFYLQEKKLETRAVLYLHTHQYDSAIYYAKELYSVGNHEPTGLMICAQVYSLLENKDSAVYYAQQVLAISNDLYHRNNSLYILTNDALNITHETLRKRAADRSDVQKLLEIRRGKMSQAAQLLKQDLNREPDWRIYILVICIVIGIIFSIIWAKVWKRRKRQMQEKVISLTDKHADNTIESIKKHIDKTDINTTLHWKNYSSMKIDADLYLGGIVSKLEEKNLNETEIRYCILTLLDFPQKEKAEILYYGYPSAIKTLKRRTSDKLGTTPPKLRNFLFSIAANAEIS